MNFGDIKVEIKQNGNIKIIFQDTTWYNFDATRLKIRTFQFHIENRYKKLGYKV